MSRSLALLGFVSLLASTACVSTDEYLRLKGEKEALAAQHDDGLGPGVRVTLLAVGAAGRKLDAAHLQAPAGNAGGQALDRRMAGFTLLPLPPRQFAHAILVAHEGDVGELALL